MEKDVLAKYEKAGRIAAEVREFGRGLIKQKSYMLDVIERLEEMIRQKGGEPAFPTQISMDHIAAHFYPDQDEKILFEDQVCKLDVGVHVGGYIGDTACTVDLSGKYGELVKASADALSNAISVIKNGTTLGEIGAAIQQTISGYGFAPVRNLSGHGLEQFDVHAAPSIPNTNTGDQTKLEKDMVVAIEPFASTGAGIVVDTSNATLFQVQQHRPIRDNYSREVFAFIAEHYGELPFAKRWLVKEFPVFKVNFALKRLMDQEILRDFAPLADRAKGIVSQAEHTLLIEDEIVRVLTKPE
ncbi:MAG: type II methionyl aminopeptidase [Candidatus Woesearchaeota archaeon]